MHLSKNQIRLLVLSNCCCWGFLGYLLLSGFSSRQEDRFKVLTAERINIVNADGTPVIAISNKERIAEPVMDGKTYPVAVADGRKYMAGMIFFNELGDEMGGLVFNSFQLPNGRVAGVGHLSFDRFKDNQVINLEYLENRNGVKSGLTLYDRPGNGNFKKSLDYIEELYFNKNLTEEEKAEIKSTFNSMSRNNEFGVQRVFLGSENEIPKLLLKDTQGKERIRLFVDSLDVAKLQFLDEKGTVVHEYPPLN
ncbi:hypothetical protein [Spongiimicrobium salis]|uniref:hypothetical protein n=1 Tax=Spongiimicrobium salis TaxID=1667022 RepID=UPI00374D537E